MARPLRVEYAGAVYHVTARGNQKSPIFKSTQDRERFLFKLEESAQRYDVRVYRWFVESGIQDIDAAFIESKRQSRLCIGSGAFHAQIDARYKCLVDGCNSKEDVSFRHEAVTYPRDVVLDAVCQVLEIDRSVLFSRQRKSFARPLAAKALCDFSGMTQREVAALFNLSSGTAVSKQLARLSVMLNQDKSLRKVEKEINRVVQNLG